MSSASEEGGRAPGLRALLPGVRRYGASTRGRTKEGTVERRVTATTGRGATLTRVTGTMLKGWTRAA
jgi:hypothetical protein